jgi:DinB superfamily
MRDEASKILGEHLVELLKGGGAHATFEDAVKNLPVELRGRRPSGLPHSPWMLLEHMRISQLDILDFSRNPKHVSPEWPEGYWPKQEKPPRTSAWEESIKKFNSDLHEMQKLVADPATDLYAQISWGDGQTILREALLMADHNAYHVAQLVDVRRLLGAWHK